MSNEEKKEPQTLAERIEVIQGIHHDFREYVEKKLPQHELWMEYAQDPLPIGTQFVREYEEAVLDLRDIINNLVFETTVLRSYMEGLMDGPARNKESVFLECMEMLAKGCGIQKGQLEFPWSMLKASKTEEPESVDAETGDSISVFPKEDELRSLTPGTATASEIGLALKTTSRPEGVDARVVGKWAHNLRIKGSGQAVWRLKRTGAIAYSPSYTLEEWRALVAAAKKRGLIENVLYEPPPRLSGSGDGK